MANTYTVQFSWTQSGGAYQIPYSGSATYYSDYDQWWWSPSSSYIEDNYITVKSTGTTKSSVLVKINWDASYLEAMYVGLSRGDLDFYHPMIDNVRQSFLGNDHRTADGTTYIYITQPAVLNEIYSANGCKLYFRIERPRFCLDSRPNNPNSVSIPFWINSATAEQDPDWVDPDKKTTISSATSPVSLQKVCAVSFSPYKSTYTHKLTIALSSTYTSGAITISAGTNSYNYTIPKSWYAGISGNSANATVTLQTFNGSTSLGTDTKTISVTIPHKATTISSVNSSINIGSAYSLTMADPYLPTYTHKVTTTLSSSYTNTSSTIAAGTKTFSYTVPTSWAAGISKTSATITVTLETFNGSTSLGTNSKTLIVNIPNDSTWQPSFTFGISGGTYTLGGTAYYIQNFSNPTLNATSITAKAGATIQSIVIDDVGKSIGSSASQSVGVITTSGSQTYSATVIDSRGYSTTKTVTITVQPYTPPRVQDTDAFRSNSTGAAAPIAGTYIHYSGTVSGTTKIGTYTNTITLVVTADTESISVTGTGAKSGTFGDGAISINKAYQVTFVVSDGITSMEGAMVIVGTGAVFMKWDKTGNNISIGCVPASGDTKTLRVASDWTLAAGAITSNGNKVPYTVYKGSTAQNAKQAFAMSGAGYYLVNYGNRCDFIYSSGTALGLYQIAAGSHTQTISGTTITYTAGAFARYAVTFFPA